MENYYYQMLSRQEQEIYRTLKEGILKLESEIVVSQIDINRINEIFFLIRLDDPLIFYVDELRYRSRKNSEHYMVVPTYLFSKQDIITQKQALQKRIQRLVEPIKEKNVDLKEKYIHDFICENVTYDKQKKTYSHEIIGPLGHGIGVCEGISKAVKALCDILGIWCIIVVCKENLEKGIKYRHAWNLIKIENQYYHLDCTFDNTMQDSFTRYDYFNLNDQEIYLDHEPSIYKIPVSNKSGNYYIKNKLAFDDEDKIYKRCLQNLKKNRTFAFKWLKSYQEIVSVYAKLKEAYPNILMTINRRQRIICVSQKEKSLGISENEFTFL